MDRYAEKAYAKINLSLDVLGKREDGYHDVAMVMQQVSIYDWILIKRWDTPDIRMSSNLSYVPTDDRNLMMKAARLMFEKYQFPGGLLMRLEKRIPVAAGMAGGSTDAAAVIKGINQIFELHLSKEELSEIGTKIGADVPFCIQGGTCLAEGIGEKLTQLPPAPNFYLVLVKPAFSVSTPVVYHEFDELTEVIHPDVLGMVAAIQEENRSKILKNMGNVLEEVTARKFPEIKQIKEDLIQSGAQCALMSGSGPTVFGLFSGKMQAMIALKEIRKKYRRTYVKMAEFVNNSEDQND